MKSVLSPRELAEAIGVSESSVKRWIDSGHIAAGRTSGGHRRISLQEAVRYIRHRSIAVVRPDLLGLKDLVVYGEAPTKREDVSSDEGNRFFEYLRAGAAGEARGLLLSNYLAGTSVADIVDGPIATAMEKVGELWVTNPSGIFWEHRATEIAIQAVSRLRLLMSPRRNAPVAVGGAPTGDRYILPSLAVAAVLEGEGLLTTNLGPETPIASLTLAAEELEADVLWLSVSIAADLDMLRREIQTLVGRLAERGAILVVGGSESSKLALPKSDSIYTGRSMAELAALVQGMRLAPSPVA